MRAGGRARAGRGRVTVELRAGARGRVDGHRVAQRYGIEVGLPVAGPSLVPGERRTPSVPQGADPDQSAPQRRTGLRPGMP
eukprot:1047729-Prymnesium_polylepis.1